jgi:hypothetical protein
MRWSPIRRLRHRQSLFSWPPIGRSSPTLGPVGRLDGKHAIFGYVVEGQDVVDAIEAIGTRDGIPMETIKIRTASIEIHPKAMDNEANGRRAGSQGDAKVPKGEAVRSEGDQLFSQINNNRRIEGVITQIDRLNSLVEISIGSRGGVKQGDKFHVVRDGKFICNILILDVGGDLSVGVMQLIAGEPQVGDRITNRLD